MSNINDLPHHLYYTLETPENQKVNHPEFKPCEVALVITSTKGEFNYGIFILEQNCMI